jgi:hypothetical protein
VVRPPRASATVIDDSSAITAKTAVSLRMDCSIDAVPPRGDGVLLSAEGHACLGM